MTTTQIEALRDLPIETLYAMLRDNLDSLETLQMARSKREASDRADLIYAALLWQGQTPADIAAAVKLGLDFEPRKIRGQARRRLPE